MLAAAGVLFVLSIIGIILINRRFKEEKRIRIGLTIVCSLIAFLSFLFIFLTGYFAFAVRFWH